MYIDIFICIQIGPSQQKQTHIPFICLNFAREVSTETDVSIKSANGPSVLALAILKSHLHRD